MSELRLRPARPSDEDALRRADDVMDADGFDFTLGLGPGVPMADYLDRLNTQRLGRGLPDGRVPATFLVAVVAGTIVGRASIRHELNDWLRAHGGHIGYGVLPEHRRRGYATEILRQALVVARSLGVDRALLTCDDDNAGSIKVIESQGGLLDPGWPHAIENSVLGRRYWIE